MAIKFTEHTITYEDIFARNIGIYTQEIQDLLKNATIAIGGAGGTGGATAFTLARQGVGHLKIADPELFEADNINRQQTAFISTLNQPKASVLERICKDINPEIDITLYKDGVLKSNVDDFVRNADVVVDAIDYNAPEDKLALYRKARENGLYVMSSPISGYGSLVFCFDPNGVTVEEIFEFPEDEKLLRKHKIPPRKLIGCELDYVAPDFFEVIASGKYIPSNGASCCIAAAAVSIDILKILLLREREKHPDKKLFPHLKDIPLVTVPYARRYDLWDYNKSKIVDLRNMEE